MYFVINKRRYAKIILMKLIICHWIKLRYYYLEFTKKNYNKSKIEILLKLW